MNKSQRSSNSGSKRSSPPKIIKKSPMEKQHFTKVSKNGNGYFLRISFLSKIYVCYRKCIQNIDFIFFLSIVVLAFILLWMAIFGKFPDSIYFFCSFLYFGVSLMFFPPIQFFIDINFIDWNPFYGEMFGFFCNK